MTRRNAIALFTSVLTLSVALRQQARASGTDFDGTSPNRLGALEAVKAGASDVAIPPLTPVSTRSNPKSCAIAAFWQAEAEAVRWDSVFRRAQVGRPGHRGGRTASVARRVSQTNRRAAFDRAVGLVSRPEDLSGCTLAELEKFSLALELRSQKESGWWSGNPFLRSLYDAAGAAAFAAAGRAVLEDLQTDHRPERLSLLTKQYEVLAAAVLPGSRAAAHCELVLSRIAVYLKEQIEELYEECEGCDRSGSRSTITWP